MQKESYLLRLPHPIPIKKYSMDLSTFSGDSSRVSQGELQSPQFKKHRKMTYDFSNAPERSNNPLQRDLLFKKMNQQECAIDQDLMQQLQSFSQELMAMQ